MPRPIYVQSEVPTFNHDIMCISRYVPEDRAIARWAREVWDAVGGYEKLY